MGEISAGEVVLSERDGNLRAHRVVEVRGAESSARVVTQGEALATRDPEISEAELLGRVAAICHRGEWRAMKTRLGLGMRMVRAIVRRSSFAGRVLLHFQAKRGQRVAKASARQAAAMWGI